MNSIVTFGYGESSDGLVVIDPKININIKKVEFDVKTHRLEFGVKTNIIEFTTARKDIVFKSQVYSI